jgi:hypothetical protein
MADDIKLANAQTKSHWETIQQWRIDEGKNFARSKSNMISRMAASGQKAGSEQWEANLAVIDAANAREKASQGGSATQGILDKWTKDMKKFYVDATKTRTSRQWVGGKGGQEEMVTRKSREGKDLERSGEANIYLESGLSKDAWNAQTTEQFMAMQFGYSEKYKKDQDFSGKQAAADAAESARQSRARATVQQASPWWG